MPKMNDIITLIKQGLAGDNPSPVYRRLADIITELAVSGMIVANDRLPPIRKLAKELSVNPDTVVNAYKLLENKRIVYSITGSGTYAAELHRDKPVVSFGLREQMFDMKNAVNFASTNTSLSLFPVDTFKGLFTEVLERDLGNAFDYEQSQGYGPLREAITEYALKSLIKTTPDNIQIISGAQQGVDIAAKAIISVKDTVCVENFTYYGAVSAFLSRQAEVIPVPMETDGMNLEHLEECVRIYRPKLIYIMTYYQTPTCVCYGLKKKRALLELASQYDFYIIEEDNLSDFTYGKEVITPLKALDYKNRVIYIKSFSKILMPGLRLGFMIMPKSVMESVKSAKYATDIETSGFVQRAFELFLTRGGLDGHRSFMRAEYRRRYDAMKEASKQHLDKITSYTPPGGGLSFWYKLPQKGADSESLCNALLRENIIAAPESLFSVNSRESTHFRLSFASVTEGEIRSGIEKISGIIRRGGH